MTGIRYHLLLVLLGPLLPAAAQTTPAEETQDPFDALYDVIMVRDTSAVQDWQKGFSSGATDPLAYEENAVTPLLWKDSRFLVRGITHSRFVEALDAFGALSQDQVEAYPPVKRALLQRHLWAVFDWAAALTANPSDTGLRESDSDLFELQRKIAALLMRLALSAEQIAALPDPVAATARSAAFPEDFDPSDPFTPFFPASLFDETGPWVCLGKSYHPIPAKMHTESEQWRSVFHIFMRLPGDRKDTLGYIEKLGDFRDQWITEKPEPRIDYGTTPHGGINAVDIYVNPATPQFPVGTRFALVEQALLLSDTGDLVLSPLITGLQLRAYLRVDLEHAVKKPMQAVAEFVIQPRQLMQGNAEMRAIGPNEHRYKTLLVGGDPFENPGGSNHGRGARLRSCIGCHDGWGIHSVNSRAQLFEARSLLAPRFTEGTPVQNGNATIGAKERDYSWGLLQGLLRNRASHQP